MGVREEEGSCGDTFSAGWSPPRQYGGGRLFELTQYIGALVVFPTLGV